MKPVKKVKCEHSPKHGGPAGYLDWHEWAMKRVSKGWTNKRCPVCKLYIEWIRPIRKGKN